MIFRPYFRLETGCAGYVFGCRWNPRLRLDREAFIAPLADVPPEPTDMQQILAFNRGHALEAVR